MANKTRNKKKHKKINKSNKIKKSKKKLFKNSRKNIKITRKIKGAGKRPERQANTVKRFSSETYKSPQEIARRLKLDKIITKEKINGFEHRAPKKRKISINEDTSTKKCLVIVEKL